MEEGPKIGTKAYDVTSWLLQQVNTFPRAYRFVLGDRIASTALDILEGLVEASHRRDKRAMLDTVNLKPCQATSPGSPAPTPSRVDSGATCAPRWGVSLLHDLRDRLQDVPKPRKRLTGLDMQLISPTHISKERQPIDPRFGACRVEVHDVYSGICDISQRYTILRLTIAPVQPLRCEHHPIIMTKEAGNDWPFIILDLCLL
jgi:hypothetical protein